MEAGRNARGVWNTDFIYSLSALRRRGACPCSVTRRFCLISGCCAAQVPWRRGRTAARERWRN